MIHPPEYTKKSWTLQWVDHGHEVQVTDLGLYKPRTASWRLEINVAFQIRAPLKGTYSKSGLKRDCPFSHRGEKHLGGCQCPLAGVESLAKRFGRCDGNWRGRSEAGKHSHHFLPLWHRAPTARQITWEWDIRDTKMALLGGLACQHALDLY